MGRKHEHEHEHEFQRTKGGKMPYTRLVEVGRVAMINYGKDYGKLVVIVDIVDAARALCDAPDMVRKPIYFKRLAITEFKLDIPKIPKLAARKEKAASTDFSRFKAMIAKKAKSAKVK